MRQTIRHVFMALVLLVVAFGILWFVAPELAASLIATLPFLAIGVTILAQETTTGIETSQRKADMSDTIYLLQPEETPFTALVRSIAKKPAINPEFNWLEDEARPWVDQVNNVAGYAAGDTSIVVDNGAYFGIGDIVFIPRTGETIRVTNVVTNTLTVTRSWGATAAAALVDNDYFIILGLAPAEGAAIGAARMTKKVKKTNYCQIFRTPLKLTGTLQASGLYGVPSDERAWQRQKAAKEHNMQIEREFWFGEKNEDTSGDPIRSTGGVDEFIVTNITTLANEAAFTKSAFDQFLESVFFYGSGMRFLFASPRLNTLITGLADSNLRIMLQPVGERDGRTYGVAITQYQSPHGEVRIVSARLLKDYRTSGDVAGKVAYALDIDKEAVAYRYLRDTKLGTDLQTPGTDAFVDEYLTECGLQVAQEKFHGKIQING